jgi:hypothetical protein
MSRGYFRTFKVLRQGDPLSPLLFNLVIDALAATLDSAKKKGRILGVVPHLIKGGITHLQYANEMVILCQIEDESILNLKLLLYCFESMSGMKVNYHKSEVFVFRGDGAVKEEIVAELNYKLGAFPMVYLGIPIHHRKLRKQDLQVVNEKMGKRDESWQGMMMSSGGRPILVNACLSNIPNYVMGFYNLIDGQHKQMDSIRGRFF